MPTELVVMRLADMRRVHPQQDNSKVCSECWKQVGIYPSGQQALRLSPAIKIICAVCAADRGPLVSVPAAPWPEIAQETRDSQDVGKA
jgi:hypothetical protein